MSLFISADEWSNNNLKVHTDTSWQIHNVQTFVLFFLEEECQVVLSWERKQKSLVTQRFSEFF